MIIKVFIVIHEYLWKAVVVLQETAAFYEGHRSISLDESFSEYGLTAMSLLAAYFKSHLLSIGTTLKIFYLLITISLFTSTHIFPIKTRSIYFFKTKQIS